MMVSRRKGENKPEECGIYLSGALLIILAIAPVTSALLYFAIPHLYPLINDDPAVISIGVDYIRWIILQAVFVGFIQANTGFWNGIGLTRVYISALTITYSIVGMIGTMELACYSVLLNLISLVGLPAWGLGTAGATLVGQALGEKNIEDASNWAWDVIKIGVLAMALIGMPFWLFPELILSIWIHDAKTLELARQPTQILGVMIAFNGIGYMLAMMLNGAGDIRRVTMVNLITQWLNQTFPRERWNKSYRFSLVIGTNLTGNTFI